MTTFSQNLKRFRREKKLTQEQSAAHLGVSPQTISRWECGTTLPDVAILPDIARLYSVSIDDLYRPEAAVYQNFAQRLGSIFESRKDPSTFLLADQEYGQLLKSSKATTEDLLLYAILNHQMMEYCRQKTAYLFDKVLQAGPQADEAIYWKAQRQKILFLSQIGRGEESIQTFQAATEQDPQAENHWICLILSHQQAGSHEKALEVYQKAQEIFPGCAMLCYFSGVSYSALGDTQQAMVQWNRALELDPGFMDAMYAKAECLEAQGNYADACQVWAQLAETLAGLGFESELMYIKHHTALCKRHIQD